MQSADNFALTSPNDYAIYLPATNPQYASVAELALRPSRPMPSGFDIEDLEFWSGTSKLWNHKFLLHSIGAYNVGTDTKGPLFRKKKGEFTFVGDSGGFQIGKGSLNGLTNLHAGMSGDAAYAGWNDNYDIKIWIINWLEQYSDYAMTLDMPLWARHANNVKSPFHFCSDQQLLAMTLENLELIELERSGRTTWLNVIQGTSPENTLTWWNAVKHYRLGGWAMAGSAGWRGGLYNMLKIMLTMNQEGAFEEGIKWLHVLGVSQAKWDIFLTAMQMQLRHKNKTIQISCDSATPFTCACAFDQYAIPPALGKRPEDWALRLETLSAVRSHADAANARPSALQSPIGHILQMHHLVVDGTEFAGRRVDELTNMMVANHNTWVILDAGRRANIMAFGGNRQELPEDYIVVLDVIEQAFATKNWQYVLDKYKAVLDRVAPSK